MLKFFTYADTESDVLRLGKNRRVFSHFLAVIIPNPSRLPNASMTRHLHQKIETLTRANTPSLEEGTAFHNGR
jgi:hypothetical protein